MEAQPALRLDHITKRFGKPVANGDISIEASPGEVVALLGENGAGKTTLMRSIAGVLQNEAQAVTFDGAPIGTRPADEIMAEGIAMVPEGRKLFPSLSVEENLLIGTYGRKTRGHWTLETVFDLFPILRERRGSPGTALSGGQQQMVAIGRALMTNPVLLILDEATEGLAPLVRQKIWAALGEIRGSGLSIILVDKNLSDLLKLADQHHIIERGRVVWSGSSDDLRSDQSARQTYLGI